MKFGFRKPSLKRRIAARTSLKRVVRHKLGVKAPRGMGIVTNPKKAVYNKIYNQVTIDPIKGASKRRRTAQNDSVDFMSTGCSLVLVALGAIIYLLFF